MLEKSKDNISFSFRRKINANNNNNKKIWNEDLGFMFI